MDMTLHPWHLILMSIFYIISGVNHFRKPSLYEAIIPKYIPYKMFWNEITGMSQIFFALSIQLPGAQIISAWSIIVLLLLMFPANINMLLDKKASLGIPMWILYLRIPLQFALIAWAYYYTYFLYLI